MGPIKRRIALVIVGLAAMFCAASAAHTQPNDDPVAYAACDEAPCVVRDTINAPPDGSAIEQLAVVTARRTVLSIAPFEPEPTPPDEAAFKAVRSILVGLPSTKARVVNCITTGLSFFQIERAESNADETDAPLTVLFMSMCLQIVKDLAKPAPHVTADVAAGGCHQVAFSIPVTVTRVGRGYSVRADGIVKPGGGLPGARVSCRRVSRGVGYQLSVQPAKPGRKLRQVLGPTLSIGFSNPSTRSASLRTAVGFR